MDDREYVKRLLSLMDENPGMPVIVRIDGEGITSEYDWWGGHFYGKPEVRTYVIDCDGSIIDRSDDYYDNCLKAITVSVSATEKEAMA